MKPQSLSHMRHTECTAAAASISLLLAAENEDIIAGCWAARISNERVMLNLGDLLLGARLDIWMFLMTIEIQNPNPQIFKEGEGAVMK